MLTLQRLVSTKRSYILKQTFNFQPQVCLISVSGPQTLKSEILYSLKEKDRLIETENLIVKVKYQIRTIFKLFVNI